jgi:type I restriction enzyme S subunit
MSESSSNDSFLGPKTIGSLAIRVGSGVTPTGGSNVYVDTGVIFIRSQNVLNSGLSLEDVAFIDEATHHRMAASEVYPFDVLLNITGASIGRCCFVPMNFGPANANQHVCSIRLAKPNQRDAQFLAAVLASHIGQKQVWKLNAGGNREGLNYQQVRSFVVPWPAQAQRWKVADILAVLDETIAQTEALITKYEQIRVGLMHDLFTRGLTPDGRLRPTATKAPHLYKESPVGWIPKDWSIVSAAEICSVITKGTTPSHFSHNDDDSSVPFIRVTDLAFDGSFVVTDDLAFVSRSEHSTSLARSKVLPGDLLMNIVGPPLGKVSLVPDDYPEWNINQAIAVFRLRRPESSQFLLHYLLSNTAQSWFFTRGKRTSGQVNLTLEMCRNLPVPFPPLDEERTKITDALRLANANISAEKQALRSLVHIRNGLRADLLTGRVRVKGTSS